MANDNHKMIAALTSGCRHRSKHDSTEKADSYYMRESELYRKRNFKYAQNAYNILGQSLELPYPNCETDKEYFVRISPVVDVKTGTKHGDDWKELSFYDTIENIPLGMKFMFSKNVWIVFNTNNTSPPINTAIVRRCNSALKRVDENGAIQVEPCVWDKDIPMQSKIVYRSPNNIFNPEFNMYAQYNDFTKTIKTDDRFIFGVGETAQAFKVKEPVQFMLGETFDDNSAQLVMISMERTLISRHLDDIENGVANRFASSIQPQNDNESGNKYKIVVTPFVDKIDRFERVTFTAKVQCKGDGVASDVIFSFADVPASCYEVSNVTSSSFDFMCLVPHDKNPLKIIAVTEVGGEELIEVKYLWLRSGL